MLAPLVVLTVLLVTGVAAAWLAVSTTEWPRADRIQAALLALLAGVAGLAVLLAVHATPWWDFNGARLAPTVGMFYGYHAYNLPDDGPVLCPHYPPLAILVFVPAAISSNPTIAILMASLCSAAIFFAPLALAWRTVPGEGGYERRLMAATLAVGLVLYTCWQPAVHSVAFNVAPDGAAIGFGALSVCAMLLGRQRKSLGWLVAAALLAACAVWTKQTLVVVPAVLGAWGVLTWGRRGWLFAFLIGAFCLLLLAVFSATFGFDRMWFNIIEIMRSSQWLDVSELRRAQGYPWRFFVWCTPPLLLGATALVASRRPLTSPVRWVDEPSVPFLVVGLALAPMCLLGRVKIGGDDHHYAPSMMFFTWFALVALYSAHERSRAANPRGGAAVRLGALVVCLVLAVAPLPDVGGRRLPLTGAIVHRAWTLPSVFGNPQESAFELIRSQPEVYYFPWNPLAALLAEGRLYHFSYGLMDRRISGYPVSQPHFEQYIPRKFKVVAVTRARAHESQGSQDWQRYLPAYVHLRGAYATDDWICLSDR